MQTTVSFEIGGLERSYLIDRPVDITAGTRLPVLVVLHGHSVTPAIELQRSGFLPYAEDGEAILVYPAGYEEVWDAGACCEYAGEPKVDDVAFITAVVDQVLADEPADRSAVYLVGYSNGGKMVYRVACFDGSLFAAYVAVEAVAVSTCGSKVPENFMEVVSTGDPEIAYDQSDPVQAVNGYSELSATAQAAVFTSLDGCGKDYGFASVGLWRLRRWVGCAGGTSVELATYVGGSHGWPLAAPGTPDAAAEIWSYVRGDALSAG